MNPVQQERSSATSSPFDAGSASATATWYKDAIFYELHIKAFFDSNNDGVGDFPGLIEKLDYLQWLGVTALCYYVGGIIVLGNSPGVCLFAPKAEDGGG